MGEGSSGSRRQPAALLLRALAYLVFWVVLAGTAPKDLAVGLVTALLAAWISLALVPAGRMTIHPGHALVLFLRFLGQSVAAGVTVARIALSPVMALRPGMIDYRTGLPPGLRRQLFMTYASLLPGTLPAGSGAGDVIAVHALDRAQDVAWQLACEELRVTRAIGGEGEA